MRQTGRQRQKDRNSKQTDRYIYEIIIKGQTDRQAET